MTLANALKDIEALPRSDQIELLHALWDRLVGSGWQPSLDQATKDELDRRLSAADADPENVLTWEDIKSHARRER